MNKGTKRLLAGLAFVAGAVGTGALVRKMKGMGTKPQRASENPHSVWARPGMTVVFRAELMPGRDRAERTARVKDFLPSGRVTLQEIEGEHAQNEFER
jgi:hypothetical protein